MPQKYANNCKWNNILTTVNISWNNKYAKSHNKSTYNICTSYHSKVLSRARNVVLDWLVDHTNESLFEWKTIQLVQATAFDVLKCYLTGIGVGVAVLVGRQLAREFISWIRNFWHALVCGQYFLNPVCRWFVSVGTKYLQLGSVQNIQRKGNASGWRPFPWRLMPCTLDDIPNAIRSWRLKVTWAFGSCIEVQRQYNTYIASTLRKRWSPRNNLLQ